MGARYAKQQGIDHQFLVATAWSFSYCGTGGTTALGISSGL
jgi:hypothetical protein